MPYPASRVSLLHGLSVNEVVRGVAWLVSHVVGLVYTPQGVKKKNHYVT